MRRVAVFADAGYIWVQLGHIVLGRAGKREDIIVDEQQLSKSLKDLISKLLPDVDLLRIYWYDGLVNGAPSDFNTRLSKQDGFKLRYGTVNSVGQQKGVDGLLIADLLNLSQNKSITDAVVISGDGDLAPGVDAAQALGAKVYCLSIGPIEASSPVLQSVADVNCPWSTKQVMKFVSKADQGQTVVPCIENLLRNVAEEVFSGLSEDQRNELSKNIAIPKAIDGALLYKSKLGLGRDLNEDERFGIRQMLRDQMDVNHGNTETTIQASLTNMQQIAEDWLMQLNDEERRQIQTDCSIPADLDRKLLAYAKDQCEGHYLTDEQKKSLRIKVKAAILTNDSKSNLSAMN